MIKVLLVEDEMPILRHLHRIVAEIDDFTVIGSAPNGAEALKVLADHRPDLVITDIRMPMMDGLTLAQEIRSRFSNLPVLFISGHRDFEYARRALQCGALDYLSKPVGPKRWREVLERVKQRVIGCKNERLKRFLTKDGKNPFDSGEYDHFRWLLVDGAADVPIHQEEYTHWPGLESYGSRRLSLLSSARSPSDPQTLTRQLSWFAAEGISLCVGRAFRSWKECKEREKHVILYYTEWEMLGKDQFLLEEAAPDPDEGGIDSERLVCLEHLLREDNVTLFSEQSSRLLEEWLTGRPRKMLFEQALRRSLDVIHRYSMTDLALAPSRRELVLTTLMERSDSIDTFLAEWRGFLKEHVLNRQASVGNHLLVQRIEAYLEQHYPHPVDAQHLGDISGVSYSYLSRVFKRNKGMTPNQFLTGIRLDRAKTLMNAEPDMPIRDIALSVGYEDPLYFSRLFKKKLGLYPTEFRCLGTSRETV